MNLVIYSIGIILIFVLGMVTGWVIRECKIHTDSDGYLRCIIDKKDFTHYPILDLNTPMSKILEKPYAIFIVANDYTQK